MIEYSIFKYVYIYAIIGAIVLQEPLVGYGE